MSEKECSGLIQGIHPDWSAPENVRSFMTCRSGGKSRSPYCSLNLATHVGDSSECVTENRRLLKSSLRLPGEPVWMKQVHGIGVAVQEKTQVIPEADAAFTRQRGRVLAVLVADCLPVLICNQQGTELAVVHGGWRGLAAGILKQAVACFDDHRLMAWLGPAIGPARYEVGRLVYARFPGRMRECFQPTGRRNHWHLDLYRLARIQLNELGVGQISGGNHCTFEEEDLFFSYRRDGTCGRMAALAWLDPN